MKTKIRSGVFETNSSSVHSIVIDKSGREPSKLPVDKDGNIIANFGIFDKDSRVYSDQSSKLSYILTLFWYMDGEDIERMMEDYDYSHIKRAICKYANANDIKIEDDIRPFIDHQSVPYYDDGLILDIYNEETVLDFIFNKYVSLKTDCD